MRLAWNVIEHDTVITVGEYFLLSIIPRLTKARTMWALTTSPDRDSPIMDGASTCVRRQQIGFASSLTTLAAKNMIPPRRCVLLLHGSIGSYGRGF